MENQQIYYEAQNFTTVQPKQETPETKNMRENFGFFGPVTLLYAIFYAFCMFKNGSGVTFPFFAAASLLFLCFSLSKLGVTLKKGSVFYMISIMLLAVSTFCTDDGRIIVFNKMGIFLLMMSLLLHQFYDTKQWKLGKYLGSIFMLVFAGIGELGRPFMDASYYFKKHSGKKNATLWYMLLGCLIAMPLIAIVMLLLSSADAVFRHITESLLDGVNMGNIVNVLFRIIFIYMASYMLTAYLCKRSLNTKVNDYRVCEPVLAITVNAMLTVIYLLFSGIQIVYLFLGKMQLPEGYTYAEYAREGFFQLLAVSILNLIIVLVTMSFFKNSKVLKAILTIMSLCTFIMIASSALRMIIYIRFYYMTFLRILVLWGLALLFMLFLGIVASIYFEKFPLFRYSTAVVTILYLVLSFSHPDLIIATINVSNSSKYAKVQESSMQEGSFFLSETPYHDYRYLAGLSADAAPVLIPYIEDMGDYGSRYRSKLQKRTEDLGIRTFNISRYIALKGLEEIE